MCSTFADSRVGGLGVRSGETECAVDGRLVDLAVDGRLLDCVDNDGLSNWSIEGRSSSFEIEDAIFDCVVDSTPVDSTVDG